MDPLITAVAVWAFVCILWLIATALLANDRWGWPAVLLLVAALSLQGTGRIDAVGFVRENIWLLPAYAAGYLGLGALWSVFKWWRFCVKVLKAYRQHVANCRDEASRRQAATLFRYNSGYMTVPPVPSHHVDRIAAWIAYWPLSIFATIVGDLLVEICDMIFEAISGLLSRISKSVFAGVIPPEK